MRLLRRLLNHSFGLNFTSVSGTEAAAPRSAIQDPRSADLPDLLMLPSPDLLESLRPAPILAEETLIDGFDAATERLVVIVEDAEGLSEDAVLELSESSDGCDTNVFLNGALVAVLKGMTAIAPENLVLTVAGPQM